MAKDCLRYVGGVDQTELCSTCAENLENKGESIRDGYRPCNQQNCWFGCIVCEYNKSDRVCQN
jgi:hypothetical protein